jgi:hypothetical protein
MEFVIEVLGMWGWGMFFALGFCWLFEWKPLKD